MTILEDYAAIMAKLVSHQTGQNFHHSLLDSALLLNLCVNTSVITSKNSMPPSPWFHNINILYMLLINVASHLSSFQIQGQLYCNIGPLCNVPQQIPLAYKHISMSKNRFLSSQPWHLLPIINKTIFSSSNYVALFMKTNLHAATHTSKHS